MKHKNHLDALKQIKEESPPEMKDVLSSIITKFSETFKQEIKQEATKGEDIDIDTIIHTLKKNERSTAKAAKALGISVPAFLQAVEKHNIITPLLE